MMEYTTFDASGKILCTGHTSMTAEEFGQANRFIEGSYFDSEYYIDTRNGIAVKKPPRPSGAHDFDYATKTWVLNTSDVISAALLKRSQLLSASDWTQLPDVPIATKAAWAEYRQALRDITGQPGFPQDIVWPAPPS